MEYSIFELNQILSETFNNSISNFPLIELKGEIIDCKVFKNNCGIGFRIRDKENNEFLCKAWANRGISILNIKKNENTNCIIHGIIKQSYFNCRYEFLLELTEDIINENNVSKIKTLKEECEIKEYFINKKEINWTSIKSIGLISKRETQGYNDFISQLKVPLDINLKEISLEGAETANEVIKAINEFQDLSLDFIIIIRGGGSTIDISNSFDKIELFDVIRNSKIPIITAIGHEADKDDKLLITNISDYDFPTPTRASIELNVKISKQLIQKLKFYASNVKNNYDYYYDYMMLKLYYKQLFSDKFGSTIVRVNNEDTTIIIERNGKFYKMVLDTSNEIDITYDDLIAKERIEKAIETRDLDYLKQCEITNEYIQNSILRIETIKNQEIYEYNSYLTQIQILEELDDKNKIEEIFMIYQ
jgi:exodeoxyribonuclease VII large subunit